MKTKTAYTKLTIEECKTRFNEKVRKEKVKRRKVDVCYMGEFSGDNYFITTTGWTVQASSWIEFKKLYGNIVDIGDKRKITYKFGFTKKLVWPVLIMLFFYGLMMLKIPSFGSVMALIISMCFVYTLLYFHIGYEEKRMISFIKELFDCEEDI